jgi:hypothetical protein
MSPRRASRIAYDVRRRFNGVAQPTRRKLGIGESEEAFEFRRIASPEKKVVRFYRAALQGNGKAL